MIFSHAKSPCGIGGHPQLPQLPHLLDPAFLQHAKSLIKLANATRRNLFSGNYGKFRVRSRARPSTIGRKCPAGSRASPRRGRARGRDVPGRRRAARGRSHPAGASSRGQPSLLVLRPVLRPEIAPLRRCRRSGVPQMSWVGISPGPASGSLCCEDPPEARWCAWSVIADPTPASTLAPCALSTARRRTSPARARAPGNVE